MFFSIFLLVILILINGMFACAELAFLSLKKTDLNEDIKKGDKRAKTISKILSNPSSFLSTIQIGITLAGFLASAFAADYFADYFINVLSISLVSEKVLRSILVVIITVILSYFTLVFGELVPKKVAINSPYKIARLLVGIINFVRVCFYPLIIFLTFSTNLICKLFKITEKEKKLTEEDIKKMILLGKEEGVIEEKEKDYILNIFKFNDVEVNKIMTPKSKVVMVNINDPLKESLLTIKKTKFSRFPVYNNNKNDILGILNVKDFIIYHNENKNIELKEIIRPVRRFDYQEKSVDVFRSMQENNESIGVIYNKDTFLGIITIEDAVEEIVGNIYDEYEIDYDESK